MVVKRRVYTQADLAERWSVNERTIQRWKRGIGGYIAPADVRLPSGRPAWSDTLVETIEQGAAA